VRASHRQIAVELAADRDNFKANVFALAIAIGPNEELCAVASLVLEVARDLAAVLRSLSQKKKVD